MREGCRVWKARGRLQGAVAIWPNAGQRCPVGGGGRGARLGLLIAGARRLAVGQVLKLSPQEQVEEAFGFRNLNPDSWRPST